MKTQCTVEGRPAHNADFAPPRRRTARWLVVLLALALAAACSDDGGVTESGNEAPAGSDPSTDGTTDEAPPDATAPDDKAPDDDPSGGQAPDEEDPVGDPPDLAGVLAPSNWQATNTGVTDDTIKIGFTYLDLVGLAESGLIKLSWGPTEAIIQAIVDDINANGGINGRDLEVVFAPFLPIGDAPSGEACTQLTEDEEVFAVLVGFLGENNLCVTELHETVLVSALGSVDRASLERSSAPWVSVTPTDERGIDALVQLLDDNDMLEGHTFGVFTEPSREANAETMASTLAARGYSVAETAILTAPLNDPIAVESELAVVAERFELEGIDTVFTLSNFIPAAGFAAVDYYPRLFSQYADTFLAGAATNPLSEFPMVAGIANYDPVDDSFNGPEMIACREAYTAATGNEILPPSEESQTEQSTGAPSLTTGCQAMWIFVQAALAAGPDLNHQTWAEGVISIGDFTMPDGRLGSFGPDKPDAPDEFELVQLDPAFDPDEGGQPYVLIGEPLVTGDS